MACIEIRTLMEVENHHDSLPRLDILKAFTVSFVDDKRSLHIGDGPMPGNPFSIGVHETYRFHFNAQFYFLHWLLPNSLASSAIVVRFKEQPLVV